MSFEEWHHDDDMADQKYETIAFPREGSEIFSIVNQ